MVTIAAAIRAALLTADPVAKVMATRQAARDWRLGRLDHAFDCAMPDRPARPDALELLSPNKMPRRKGGGIAGQVAMLHALAHIEFVAIDLALDMAGRFGEGLSRDFVSDWLGVAADEAMHFALLDRRLRSLGSHYGAHPAHDGLWEAAETTAHDVLARIAIVPLVLEARGLDVSPATIARFENQGDSASAKIMKRIYADEIRHVRVGTIWFTKLCDSHGMSTTSHWQSLVRTYFRGGLKPPFNDSARESAGLTQEYYGTLAIPAPPPHSHA
jgi:uncharacterized ferritin-like protein (DUF455 family)